MKIFDGHTHVEQGRAAYDLKGVTRWNVIFNSIESYSVHRHLLKRGDSATLLFDYQKAYDVVARELKAGRVQALKIHARTQRLGKKDYPALEKRLASLRTKRPVIYDAFYYGDDLQHQPSLEHLIRLATVFPEIPFVVAHSGGYEVLKYFFHLRPLANIHYDLSFSLHYLHDTSCFQDLVKLIQFTDKSKILFGSDYPWVFPKRQLAILKGIFQKLRLAKVDQEKILYHNADRLFSL